MMQNAAVIYWSKGGNTAQVAREIYQVLHEQGLEVTFCSAEQAGDLDWFAYDLLCLGFPSYHWHPPKPVDDWLKERFRFYHQQGLVKVGSPQVPHFALIFCTYSGPHTGVDEAIPATHYAGQFFAHLGFTVIDQWHIVGEFHGSEELSTKGRLGDIRGRPNSQDLEWVRDNTRRLVEQLQAETAS
jgi:hypothetical protein